jgi:hypothetical protein
VHDRREVGKPHLLELRGDDLLGADEQQLAGLEGTTEDGLSDTLEELERGMIPTESIDRDPHRILELVLFDDLAAGVMTAVVTHGMRTARSTAALTFTHGDVRGFHCGTTLAGA